jgi:hypothetical protein
MSLLSALLEDDLAASEIGKPPFYEVWIAIRTDGDSSAPNHLFGDASRENPYAANTATSFPNVMNRAAQYGYSSRSGIVPYEGKCG